MPYSLRLRRIRSSIRKWSDTSKEWGIFVQVARGEVVFGGLADFLFTSPG